MKTAQTRIEKSISYIYLKSSNSLPNAPGGVLLGNIGMCGPKE